jgi:hypothetical protein
LSPIKAIFRGAHECQAHPIAEQEYLLMRIEHLTTRHTSDVIAEQTRSLAERLCGV